MVGQNSVNMTTHTLNPLNVMNNTICIHSARHSMLSYINKIYNGSAADICPNITSRNDRNKNYNQNIMVLDPDYVNIFNGVTKIIHENAQNINTSGENGGILPYYGFVHV